MAQLNLIPADSKTLETLKKALDEFTAGGGDRVGVRLEGSKLKMESVVAREGGVDVSRPFQGQEFYLVTSAARVAAKEALAGP